MEVKTDASNKFKHETSRILDKGERPTTSVLAARQIQVIDFEDADDPTNPQNWSVSYKWTVLALVSMMAFVNTLGSVITAPSIPVILCTFSSTNRLYTTLLVSVYEMGEAIGPLLVAPLSEAYGRLPVWHASNFMFVSFAIGCACSTNISMLVAFRFLSGCASAPTTIGPSIIGDVFVPEKRGLAMSLNIIGPLIGPVAGPVAGGFLVQSAGWRWPFWVLAIAGGAFALPSLFLLRESYKVIILRRKAQCLRKESPNSSFRSKYDDGSSKISIFKRAINRPAQLAIVSPIVLILSLYASIVYGYLYIVFTTMTEVFQGEYGFSQGTVGLTYLGLGVGFVVGLLLYASTSDVYAKRKGPENMKPEDRLPFLAVGSFVIPLGLFLYGWTTQRHVQWMAPITGTGLVGLGVMLTSIPTKTYFVDAFELHAASAVAVTVVIESVIAVVLPLAGPPLYANLGLGWGNSLLALIALGFAPVPFVLMKYGQRLRENPRFQIEFSG